MKRTVIFLFALLSLFPCLLAQETPDFLQIAGKVVDGATGKPLHYASINLSGTNISNVTNAEGFFTLKVDARTLPTAIVTISHLGYATKALKIADFEGYTNDNPYKVILSPVSLTLNPALIRAQDPVELVLAALYRIKQNYPDKYVGMTAFYRELVKKGNNRYLAMNEAVIDINKAPYTTFQIDRAGIYKGRGSQDQFHGILGTDECRIEGQTDGRKDDLVGVIVCISFKVSDFKSFRGVSQVTGRHNGSRLCPGIDLKGEESLRVGHVRDVRP